MYTSRNFETETTVLGFEDISSCLKKDPQRKKDFTYLYFLHLWERILISCPDLKIDFCQTAEEKRDCVNNIKDKQPELSNILDIHELVKSIRNPNTWIMQVYLSREYPQYVSKPNREAFWDIVNDEDQLYIERINPEGEHFWGEEGDEYYLLACTYTK